HNYSWRVGSGGVWTDAWSVKTIVSTGNPYTGPTEYVDPKQIKVEVIASSVAAPIAKVELYEAPVGGNATLVGATKNTSPGVFGSPAYIINWNAAKWMGNPVVLTAKAYDTQGNFS